MTACRTEVLRLYKSLLKEGSKFSNYNFRTYTQRRVKDAFRQHQSEKNVDQIKQFIAIGHKNLDIIKRQVIVGNLYRAEDLVIEKQTHRNT